VENAHQSGATDVQVHATSSKNDLVVQVRDDGRGMTEAELQQATLPFYTTRSEGRGLGLYFARRVVEGLSGTLDLTSIPGEGTTVRVTLPMIPESAP
ncbi:MAG: ATP-binding protein, partial [Myxococcota bacterium]